MKRNILLLFFAVLFSPLFAQYEVSGGSRQPLLANKNGITEIYLLNGLEGAQIRFTSSQSAVHQWYRYKESIDDAVPVSCTQSGNTSEIIGIQGGYGYYVAAPEGVGYVWIIDYSRYVPRFFNLEVAEEEDKCTFLKILADVEAEPLGYYLPSGAPANLVRTYRLQYNSQEWQESEKMFLPKKENIELKGLISEFVISAPLETTFFTLSGDNFAEYFDIQQMIRSDEYRAIAVEAHGTAETDKEHADNEVHGTGNALGGSAPIEYTFTAYANEPVAAMYIWKVLQQDSITGELTAKIRYTDKVLRYNFDKEGIYRVELEVVDGQSVCVDTTQFFNVMINNTMVKIPNVFSPGSSIGVNDELRVSFTSLVTFKASVYNRWGNLLYQWSDATKGWDGRVNGKFVPTGVYYVIVEYKDASGKNQSASKAVNVLRAKNK